MPLRMHKGVLELRGMILNGELEPGQRLREVDLSNRLGISRTPIREAFNKLEAEGLLDRLPSGGFSVRSFTKEDVVAAIEIRGVIEGTVARLAAEAGADRDHLQQIEHVVMDLDAVVSVGSAELDFSAYTDLNARFHALLGKLVKSRVFQRELARVSQLPFASPNAFLDAQSKMDAFRQSLFVAQQQHRELVDAIKARQGSRAEHIAREHARLALNNLQFVMAEDHDLRSKVPGLVLVAG